MASPHLSSPRITALTDLPVTDGTYVLYWMQQSQRAEENHALGYAVHEANRIGVPVVVAFCITPDYPDANLRHYTFMLEGLKETCATLAARGIRLVLRIGEPVAEIITLGRDAALIVCDRGYMRHQRCWREQLAKESGRCVIQVETDVVAPVDQVSDKAEYAAYTIRPKLHRLLPALLRAGKEETVRHSSLPLAIEGVDPNDIPSVLDRLAINRRIRPVSTFFKGGTTSAKERFRTFLREILPYYTARRNEPKAQAVSFMSPYLHFGQISPLYLALEAKRLEAQYPESVAAFLEELIVRRELAMNFVNFHPSYDSLSCLPDWAQKTLLDHKEDKRQVVYSKDDIETCQTHDAYFNAAMGEMKITGFMHNYMRMYWGKKILEWSESPEEAYNTIISLNNAYFLDGRDPNSYAGAGWIFGRHDRAWFERPVFGKIRYMAASGLERKCDIKGYVSWVNQLNKGEPAQ